MGRQYRTLAVWPRQSSASRLFICAIIILMCERRAPTSFAAKLQEFKLLQDSLPQEISCEDDKEYGFPELIPKLDYKDISQNFYPIEKVQVAGEAETPAT